MEMTNGTEEIQTGVDWDMQEDVGEGLMLKQVANADASYGPLPGGDASMPQAAMQTATMQERPVPAGGFRAVVGAVKSFGQKMSAGMKKRAEKESAERERRGQQQGSAADSMLGNAMGTLLGDIEDPFVRNMLQKYMQKVRQENAEANMQQTAAKRGREAAGNQVKDKLAGKAAAALDGMGSLLKNASSMANSLFGAAHDRQERDNARDLQDDARRFGPQAGRGVPC